MSHVQEDDHFQGPVGAKNSRQLTFDDDTPRIMTR